MAMGGETEGGSGSGSSRNIMRIRRRDNIRDWAGAEAVRITPRIADEKISMAVEQKQKLLVQFQYQCGTVLNLSSTLGAIIQVQ